MKRRTLIAACALTPLAACAGLTEQQIASRAVQDMQLVANGLNAAIPELATVTGIPVATLTNVSALFGKAVAAAQGVSASITATAAQSVVTQVVTYFNEAATMLSGLPLPPAFSTTLTALKVLLPVVEVAVGLPVPVGAAPGGMTPDQARAVLAAV
jgi:hypothetical protein